MWCPKCKSEFLPGITVCPNCKVELVEELNTVTKEENKEVAIIGDKDLCNKITDYLKHINIPYTVEEKNNSELDIDESDEEAAEEKSSGVSYVISVPSSKAQDASREISIILKVENERTLEENPELAKEQAEKIIERMKAQAEKKEFKTAKERHDDYRSSGYMFVVFGAILIVFAILNLTGSLNLFPTFSSIVIAVLGVAFGVIGLSSLKKAKTLILDVENEESAEDSIEKWLKENITLEVLNRLDAGEENPELLYIKQSAFTKAKLLEAFPETHEDHADEIVDNYLDSIL